MVTEKLLFQLNADTLNNSVDTTQSQVLSGFSFFLGLTKKQIKAIEGLISLQKIEDAAKFAGITDRTLYRWMKNESFQRALQAAIQETSAETMRRLVAGRNDALDTIYHLMLNAKSENVRKTAAKDWWEITEEQKQLQDIEKRLSEIEEILKGR